MPDYPNTTAFFSRHLVSIGFTTNAPGTSGIPLPDGRRIIVASGSTYQHNGHVFLVSAGHIIKPMKELVAAGHSIERCQLYDNFHQTGQSRLAIPFPFRPEDAIPIDSEEGLDLAIIRLSPNTQALLLANGVVPLNPDSCRNCPSDITDYMMLGLPADSNRLIVESNQYRVVSTPRLIPLQYEPNPPSECTHEMPLWYGHVPEEAGDIQGMSGGLVLGARLGLSGEDKYWPVGIQSGWFEPRRLSFAVPAITIPILLDKLAEAFRRNAAA